MSDNVLVCFKRTLGRLFRQKVDLVHMTYWHVKKVTQQCLSLRFSKPLSLALSWLLGWDVFGIFGAEL